MIAVNVSWDDVKVFLTSRKASLQYVETSTTYLVIAIAGQIGVQTTIYKNNPPDDIQTNFEQTYKCTANNFLETQISIYANAGKMFSVTSGIFSPLTTSEVPVFLLVNNQMNLVSARFKKMVCYCPYGNNNIYNFYINPTVSYFGTPLTVVGNRQVSFQATPVLSAFKNPTATLFGSLFYSANAASSESILDFDFSKWIDPGNSLLITVSCGSVSNTAGVSLEYTEQ